MHALRTASGALLVTDLPRWPPRAVAIAPGKSRTLGSAPTSDGEAMGRSPGRGLRRRRPTAAGEEAAADARRDWTGQGPGAGTVQPVGAPAGRQRAFWRDGCLNASLSCVENSRHRGGAGDDIRTRDACLGKVPFQICIEQALKSAFKLVAREELPLHTGKRRTDTLLNCQQQPLHQRLHTAGVSPRGCYRPNGPRPRPASRQ